MDPTKENNSLWIRIDRCISVGDPVARSCWPIRSAVGFTLLIYFEDDNWHLRDTSSRNGTLVNGQKTDQARLLDKSVLTDRQYRHAIDRAAIPSVWRLPHSADRRSGHMSTERSWQARRTMTRLANVASTGHSTRSVLAESAFAEESTTLTNVIDTVIELLRDRTSADVVGLSFDSGDGKLKPKRCPTSDQADRNHAWARD